MKSRVGRTWRGRAERRRRVAGAVRCTAVATWVAAMVAALGQSAAEAVVVAPHALFIDHRTRSAVLYLQNPSDVPAEFSVRLQYGYPVTDSTGSVYVKLFDEVPSGEPSAAGWVRALPARAIVQPGQRQAIRLLAQPPADLPDGEYWSRIIVTSRAAQMPVALEGSESVQVGLTLEMRTITSLTYRKGLLSTGVDLRSCAAEIAGDRLVVDLDLERSGNAAYLGRLDLTLLDGVGQVIGEWQQALAVYREFHRRLELPVASVAPGRYTLRLRVSTERDDIPQREVLPAPPVEQLVSVSIR